MRILKIPVYLFSELSKSTQKEVVEYNYEGKTYSFIQDEIKMGFRSAIDTYEQKINYTKSLRRLDREGIDNLFVNATALFAGKQTSNPINVTDKNTALQFIAHPHCNIFTALILENFQKFFERKDFHLYNAHDIDGYIHKLLNALLKQELKRTSTKGFYREQLNLDKDTEYFEDGVQAKRNILRYSRSMSTV